MFNISARFVLAPLFIFSFQALSAEVANDKLDLIQSDKINIQQTLLKLDQSQLKARKIQLTNQVERLSVNKSETQNPHTNKQLTSQLKDIFKELELIEQMLLAAVGLNIIIGDSNDGVGLGAGGSSGGNSGTGTGTGG